MEDSDRKLEQEGVAGRPGSPLSAMADSNVLLLTVAEAATLSGFSNGSTIRLAGIGAADTVSHQAAVALTGRSTLFYNPYAAVPSLHVGFACAIAIAAGAAAAGRTQWTKALVLLWGPLVTTAVVATGNHYLLDVAAGLIVTAVGFFVARLISRLFERRSGTRRAPSSFPPPGADV
jgi:membrane-associated phospholipid phosphatase